MKLIQILKKKFRKKIKKIEESKLVEKVEEVAIEPEDNRFGPTNKRVKKLWVFRKRLMSLGVNGKSQVDFMNLLFEKLENSIEYFSLSQEREKIKIADKILVVDVRQNPYVKTGFRPNELLQALEANEIEYNRFNHLGNPFYKRHLKEKNWLAAKKEYQDYLKSNEKAQQDFNTLFAQFRFRKLICIICYCNTEDPRECHRFWLIEALINRMREKLGFTPNYVIQNHEIQNLGRQTTLTEVLS